MSPPKHMKSLHRIIRIFSCYSQWISSFPDETNPLVENKTFPLPQHVRRTFDNLKKCHGCNCKPGHHLVAERDALDIPTSAPLSQDNRPVALFPTLLTDSERHRSTIEKKVCEIIKAVRKWRHYLWSTRFNVIIDKRYVTLMYDSTPLSKIKNDKIERRRL